MGNFTTLVNIENRPRPPHVAICVPSPEIGMKDMRTALRDLRDMAKQDFLISDVEGSGSDIVSLRNLLRVGADMDKAEWLLFLDSDMVFPPDTLHRLMSHGKDIVGATYVRRAGTFGTLGHRVDGGDIETIWREDGLVDMAHMPMGCMLVKRTVFDKLDKPHFQHRYTVRDADSDLPGGITSEDHAFCERVREAGYNVWCDATLSKHVGHIGFRTYFWNDKLREGLV